MVGALISVKKYLTVPQDYPGLLYVVDIYRVFLGICLSSWASAKHNCILTCEGNIAFDFSPESWPVFHIELTGIIIQCGLLQLFSPTPSGDGGNLPLHHNYQ